MNCLKSLLHYATIKYLFFNALFLCLLTLSLDIKAQDEGDVVFGLDPGKSFTSKPSFSQRLSGVRDIVLLVPSQTSQYDNYIYGNYIDYFRGLGLNVKVVKSSNYQKKTSTSYGAPMLWCNFIGNLENYCEKSNSLIVGLSYGTSPGADDCLVLWAKDVPNNFSWEVRINDVPNKGSKLIEKFKNSLCYSYTYNKNWEYRPKYIESNLTEQKIKEVYYAGENVAIYQGDNYRLGIYHPSKDDTFLVYLGGHNNNYEWQIGDIKASLEKTSTPGVYLAKWWGKWKQTMNFKVIISEGMLKTYDEDDNVDTYIQVFPTADVDQNTIPERVEEWSGSGFALYNGYVVTNYHVIENAKNIDILGVSGNFNIAYNAEIIATDKYNDLAILKINDNRFSGFGQIPYRIKTQTSDVGEDIFVLGYPLISTMGEEIKLTTGIISSKTGFQGDNTVYQISAPLQPGNSGGPMFDKNGNMIGIVNSKHTGAENVGYAIKASYLSPLVDRCGLSDVTPKDNRISQIPLTSKVKRLKNYVFMIKCSSSEGTVSHSQKYSNSKAFSRQVVGDEIHVSNPQCTTKKMSYIKLKEVIITKYKTILNFETTNTFTFEDWYSIKSDSYITADGIQYNLMNAVGIGIYPHTTTIPAYGILDFSLEFPAIPQNTEEINFTESANSRWNISSIKLK
jgi:S1-C subfamily serine protease